MCLGVSIGKWFLFSHAWKCYNWFKMFKLLQWWCLRFLCWCLTFTLCSSMWSTISIKVDHEDHFTHYLETLFIWKSHHLLAWNDDIIECIPLSIFQRKHQDQPLNILFREVPIVLFTFDNQHPLLCLWAKHCCRKIYRKRWVTVRSLKWCFRLWLR